MKKLMSTLLALCLLLSVPASASAAADVAIRIDADPVTFTGDSGSPYIDANSRTMVPLRVTMESYGCEVYWDNENQNAIVYKDGVTVVCPIGESYIEVNGERRDVDTAAVVKNGRTYLPIRCVLEAVGATVGWDGASRTVLVTRGETDVSRHQEAYIQQALDAVNANFRLSEEKKIEVRAAAEAFLTAIPVTEDQAKKICTRLENLTLKIEDSGHAGTARLSSENSYTITMLTALWDSALLHRRIFPDTAVSLTLVHELNHVYSESPSTTWFQEGMASVLNGEIRASYDSCNYEGYERICFLLLEICGPENVLPCYFTGDETPLCDLLNDYAGISNAKSVLKRCGDALQNNYDAARYNKDENASKAYLDAAAELTELFEQAYQGKYGANIHDDALCEVYLSWLNDLGSLFVIKAGGDFTCSIDTPPFYYNRENYHAVVVIKDAQHRMSEDGEFMYYRY